ncbi:MAG: transposase [Thermodesulfobacteriota bacterium]|nr:MAG: transposase [Thermodesulfobacteriota bacterium]
MPRQARLDAPGTLHHVMIRGIEGITIFRDDDDKKDFLCRVGDLAEKTKTRILAWALMSNHVHLLFFSGPKGISTFMRRLLTGYSLRFNRKHQRSGHLFQNRYKSIVCEQEPYLLELVRYLHLNPLRAKIVKDLRELDRFPWSGHSVLMGKQESQWQEKDYVLGLFGRKRSQAIRAYRKFVEGGIVQGRRPELTGGGLIRSMGGWSRVLSLRKSCEKTENDARVLGGSDFVAAILLEAGKTVKRQIRNPRDKKAIKAIIKNSCNDGRISEKELRAGGKRREVTKVRGEIAGRLSREFGLTMAEIARELGVGASAIRMILEKMVAKK